MERREPVAEVDLDELLRRAVRRDAEALAKLVDLYSPRVYGLLFRLSGSREVAEDLLQETFLRVVRTIEEYEHAGKFEPWLFRIAANLVRDRSRQVRRRGTAARPESAQREGDEAGGFERVATDHDPARRLAQQEAIERLEACLQQLSEPEREILLLRHYSGLSFAEIAAILGVPLGTALARAHRALSRLRAEFGGEV